MAFSHVQRHPQKEKPEKMSQQDQAVCPGDVTASYHVCFQRMLLNIAASFYGNLLVLNGNIHYTS